MASAIVLVYRKIRQYDRTLLILIPLLIASLLYAKIAIVLLFALPIGFINYIIHSSGIHMHLGLVSHFNLLFSYALGWKYGLVLIILSHIIPEVLSGHFDMEMIITAGVYMCIGYLATVFHMFPFVVLGVILIIIAAILSCFLGLLFGTPPVELATEHGTELVLNLFYFKYGSEFLLSLIL